MTGPDVPTALDFIRAVQAPDAVFTAPALQSTVFDLHPIFRIPMPASGSTAVVFRAHIGAEDYAVRFFTRADASSEARYRAVGEFIAAQELGDDVPPATWIDDAITLHGRTWPAVLSPWVDGHPLDSTVEKLVEKDDRPGLSSLAATWRSLVARLQNAGFAHGELSHGNIIIDGAARIRLIDLDSAWVPSLDGAPPPGGGVVHPNYDRVGRTWDRWMDTFPSLVIYISLFAIGRYPGLWRSHFGGDGMIFSMQDYEPPFRTPVWRDLARLGDPDIERLVRLLQRCCDAPSWRARWSLEDLLSGHVSSRMADSWTRPAGIPSPPSPPPSSTRTQARISDDDVQFTVYRPHVVRPKRPSQLLVFAHRSAPYIDQTGRQIDPRAEVDREARGLIGPDMQNFASVVADSAATLARGNELAFEPWIEEGEISPVRGAFLWEGPIHHVEFTFHVPTQAAGRRLGAGVRVFIGVLILADIRFVVNVQADVTIPPPELVASARPYRQIFASYSHRDTEIVQLVRAAVTALGDRYLIDVDALRAGERWEPRIADLITRSDIFQLFWSSNSMRSNYVRREWEHALALDRPHFVRPVFWEDPLPKDPEMGMPPEELSRLHFWKLAPALSATPSVARRPASVAPVPANFDWHRRVPSEPPLPTSSSTATSSQGSARTTILVVVALLLVAALIYAYLR